VDFGRLNTINRTLTSTRKWCVHSFLLSCFGIIGLSTQVLKRCYTTLNPIAASSYLSVYLNPADLYGPFWTLSTLIFALFLSSSLGASIAKYLSTHDKPYDYDFQLLSIAVSLVYAYGLALPVMLWLALRYLGVGEWSVVEAVAVWGYGQFVWIPVAVWLFFPSHCILSMIQCQNRFFVLFLCQLCVGPLLRLHLVCRDGFWAQTYTPFWLRYASSFLPHPKAHTHFHYIV
jgi:hypothetical protein